MRGPRAVAMAAVESFPPIADARARLLIVGSMPGEASLAAGRYYAHPRNAFWPILGEVLGFDAAAPYGARTAALRAAGIALWDVLQRCERAGSLDSAIVAATAAANDFAGLLRRCPRIAAVLCNGATAHREFTRRVLPGLGPRGAGLAVIRLPSTSPAHAGMARVQKRTVWRAAIAAGGITCR
ncbi:MAG: DNA-deoxyinosine glycosylase [Planctomycetota bacterium]